MEYLPREDGFPSGFALGKTILPRETFHHGIPSGMSYLYNIVQFIHNMEFENLEQHIKMVSSSVLLCNIDI